PQPQAVRHRGRLNSHPAVSADFAPALFPRLMIGRCLFRALAFSYNPSLAFRSDSLHDVQSVTEVRRVPRHFRHDAARLILESLRLRRHCRDVDLLTVDETELEIVFVIVRLAHPYCGDRFVSIVGSVPVVKRPLCEIEFGVDLTNPVRGEEERSEEHTSELQSRENL